MKQRTLVWLSSRSRKPLKLEDFAERHLLAGLKADNVSRVNIYGTIVKVFCPITHSLLKMKNISIIFAKALGFEAISAACQVAIAIYGLGMYKIGQEVGYASLKVLTIPRSCSSSPSNPATKNPISVLLR